MLLFLLLPACVHLVNAVASSALMNQAQVEAANGATNQALVMRATFNMVDGTLIPLNTGLDPAAAPGAAAEAMRAVGDTGCATVTAIVDDAFTVAFGDGCARGDMVVSGTVAVSVGYPEGDPNLRIGLVFTNLEVDRVALEGEAGIVPLGIELDAALRLTHGATELSADRRGPTRGWSRRVRPRRVLGRWGGRGTGRKRRGDHPSGHVDHPRVLA